MLHKFGFNNKDMATNGFLPISVDNVVDSAVVVPVVLVWSSNFICLTIA